MNTNKSFVCGCGASWTGCGAFQVNGEWAIASAEIRNDDLMSDGNLAVVAGDLTLCEDASTLRILREIYPADVLKAAARRLDRVSFQRIRRWTIKLNQNYPQEKSKCS